MSWLAYWWPGLQGLHRHGKILPSLTAISYGLLLGLGVASAWVWPQLLEGTAEQLLWTVLFLLAVATFFVGDRIVDEADEQTSEPPEGNDVFRAAMTQYLRGDWFSVERNLKNALRQRPRDIECRLLLATMFRHTGRLEEAQGELLYISRVEQAWRWDVELQREWGWLQEALTENGTEEGEKEQVKENAEEVEDAKDQEVDSQDDSQLRVYPLGAISEEAAEPTEVEQDGLAPEDAAARRAA